MTIDRTQYAPLVQFFRENRRPYYFVSPTNFNLLGIEDWVSHWTHINFIDVFDGKNPTIFVPNRLDSPVFESMEDLNQYLLEGLDVSRRIIAERQTSDQSYVMFLFFNPALESVCNELGLRPILNPHQLVHHIDSKIETTKLGDSVGVASVPNIMTTAQPYEALCEIALHAGLGSNWVIQLPYGDSGKTTFFISSQEDYETHRSELEDGTPIKLMKQIRCVGTAIEGVATRWGTFVGPLMGELIGEPSLTPYPGGWCGNDINPNSFSSTLRLSAQSMTIKLGQALYEKGYRGYFEVDYLLDLDSDQLYLGELNPRISGVTALTSLSRVCQEHAPLFLFHLAEFSNYSGALNPDEFNRSSVTIAADEYSGQFIIKYTEDSIQKMADSPPSGIYRFDNGQLFWVRDATHPGTITTNEVFLFRIISTDDYVYHGADLAICFFRRPILNERYGLDEITRDLISTVRALFVTRLLTQDEQQVVDRYNNPGFTLKGSMDE
ncbi:biotin carboxylase [bacterium]|nr:biotin carboxylase [bacterium]